MTETPTIEVKRSHTPAQRGAVLERAGRDGPRGGDLFEAPLFTVPYPLEACRGAFLDARDLDMEDFAALGLAGVSARVARLGRL